MRGLWVAGGHAALQAALESRLTGAARRARCATCPPLTALTAIRQRGSRVEISRCWNGSAHADHAQHGGRSAAVARARFLCYVSSFDFAIVPHYPRFEIEIDPK